MHIVSALGEIVFFIGKQSINISCFLNDTKERYLFFQWMYAFAPQTYVKDSALLKN